MTEAVDSIPPLDDIDAIFELPDVIDDAQLRTVYESLVVRLRRELQVALAKPPSTIQLLITERAAFNYVLMKQKDKKGVGNQVTGWAHMTAVKEFNAFWLNLAESLNKMMQAGQTEYREALIAQVGTVVNGVLRDEVPDENTRKVLRSRLASELMALGL